MTLRAYIWGMRFFTVFSLVALGAVVFYVDPESSGIFGIFLFYLTAFFFLSGVSNLFLLFVRRKFLGNELAAEKIEISFRQGILLSIIILGMMILQSYGMLIWWTGLLVFGGVLLVELYFLSRS